MELTCWALVAAAVAMVLGCTLCMARNRPPGPWNLPVLGYLLWLDPKKPYVTLAELSRRYGPVYGLYLGDIYTVVVSDAKLIRKVFNIDAASGRAPLHLTHGIMKGYGLICAQGDLWKDQRKFVYNSLRLLGATRIGQSRKEMQALILDNVNDLVHHLKSFGDSALLDPLEPLRHSLGSVINILVFGRAWSRDDATWKWLLHLQEEGTKLIGVAGPLNFLPFLRFLPKSKRTIEFLLEGKRKTHEIYKKLIEEQEQTFSVGSDTPKNLIQAFLAERSKRGGVEREKYYNSEQFCHLLADIFGASLDTTLTTLRWYFLYLATHQSAQNRARSEILEVLGERCVSLEDFASLPYVEATIAETQRIRSVVPVGIPHGTLSTVEIGGYEIPERTMVVPLQWALHMDPKLWPEPNTFDPNRFLDENGRFFKPESFLPFQTGKRMCVGDELARMFLFFFAVRILQNFEISTDGTEVDLEGDCGITLTPKSHKLLFKSV